MRLQLVLFIVQNIYQHTKIKKSLNLTVPITKEQVISTEGTVNVTVWKP